MFKRWFEFSSNGDSLARTSEYRNGSADQALALIEPPEEEYPSEIQKSLVPSDQRGDFEQIYSRMGVKPASASYGILKVVEMTNSAHLAGLPPEARRGAVLMAIEAVGAKAEDLLQDAVTRQRALNDYEKEQENKLHLFEDVKAEENQELQSEIERLTTQYMSRVHANLDEVAREQDKFRAWQRSKELEVQRIADAAAFCVPDSLGRHGGSLTSVLERACAAQRERP